MPNRHAGPKFFARAGKSTWIGVYRYPNGKLLGPFVDRATRYVGDITCDVWNSAYTDVLLNGSGPAYIDLHPDQARRPRLHARGHDQRRTYHAGGLHGPHRPRRFQARRGIHAVRAAHHRPRPGNRHRRPDLRSRPLRRGRHGGQLPRRHRWRGRVRLDCGRSRRRFRRLLRAQECRNFALGCGTRAALQQLHGTRKRRGLEGSQPRRAADHGFLRRCGSASSAFGHAAHPPA